MPPGPDPAFERRLNRALWRARLIMLWEQGAGVWIAPVLAIAAVVVAALWGLFDGLSALTHTAILGVAGLLALVLAVRGALKFRWPDRQQACARLEADSQLVHAPLSGLDDSQAAGDPALWNLHRARAMQAIAQVRVGGPRAGLAAADPMALRYALAIAAVLALWARGPDRIEHLAAGFQPFGQRPPGEVLAADAGALNAQLASWMRSAGRAPRAPFGRSEAVTHVGAGLTDASRRSVAP